VAASGVTAGQQSHHIRLRLGDMGSGCRK